MMLDRGVVLGLEACAIDTGDGGFACGVVTLQAHAITGRLELGAVRIMTIAAAHALGEHLALGEGAVLEHLVLDLAVECVQLAGQPAWQVVIHQPTISVKAITQRRAAGMAARTGFHFADVVGVGQAAIEAEVGLLARFGGPLQVSGRRAMAGLATHSKAVPLAVERPAGGIEVTFEAGGVALHAHEVGVLLRFAPVQRVLEVHPLAWIEVEPLLLLGIPGNAKGLQMTLAGVDQVLLQRLDTKGIGHPEILVLAIGAHGVDPELLTLTKESGGLVLSLELAVGEIAEHRLLAGILHGQLVVRAFPVIGLGLVTALALSFIYQRCRGRCDRRRRRRGGGHGGHGR
ncbi:hypothetical protein D3C77_199160 [compost metagenome]